MNNPNSCSLCSKDFANRRNLLKHNRKIHKIFCGRGIRDENIYKCAECDYVCHKKIDIKRHVMFHSHPNPSRRRKFRLQCSECDEVSPTYKDLREHISNVHKIELRIETLRFKNEEEFLNWKSRIQQEETSEYVLNCGEKKTNKGLSTRYFVCHRSYELKQKTIRKRKLKSSGSNKTGKACPAGFTVRKGASGSILVQSCNTHIGHECTLGQVPLPEEDRKKIAGKLNTGVEISRILDDVRDSARGTNLKRIHLLDRKDIHNIKQSLGIIGRRHEDDATSVHLWESIPEVPYGDVITEENLPFQPRELEDDDQQEEEIQTLLQTLAGSIRAKKNLDNETRDKLKNKLRSCISLINVGNSEQYFKA